MQSTTQQPSFDSAKLDFPSQEKIRSNKAKSSDSETKSEYGCVSYFCEER